MSRLVIDPVTRTGGHLRIEVDVTGGMVQDAWSTGTVFRGMERILRDRDPRDAWLFAERICGMCTGTHALASVRAVESALHVAIPSNARLLRNLLAGASLARDHVLQFYQQSVLDWVDVEAALDADPAATSRLAGSISDWPVSSTSYFKAVRDRLAAHVASGRLGPFAGGYWGHPAYKLPPEADLMIMAHYLESLDWQRRIGRAFVLLGGKDPHPQTFLVGGMALTAPWGGPVKPLTGEHPRLPGRESPMALSKEGLAELQAAIAEMRAFVDRVYVPDALAVARYDEEWLGLGAGPGDYLSAGEFSQGDTGESPRLLPRGLIRGGDPKSLHPIDQAAIAETVANSWYRYDDGDASLLHPSVGQTEPSYTGPDLPYASLEGSDGYSWLKAPRYAERPMEVGPLARILVAYAAGVPLVRAVVDDHVARVGLGPEALTGTLGRIVARAIEAQVVVDSLGDWLDELRDRLETGDLSIADITAWDPDDWPADVAGWSLGESPRGTVGHWVRIGDRKVVDYQVVDATTWNASPRDVHGWRGPLETALVGTPVADPARPLEVLRTVHAFAPCTACATHLAGRDVPAPIEIRIARGGAR